MEGKLTKEDIELIRLVVREEISDYRHECRFDASDEDIKQFGDFIGMTQELGKGRILGGVGVIRDNNKWVSSIRKKSDKLSSIILVTFITLLAGGVFAAFWRGLKSSVGK